MRLLSFLCVFIEFLTLRHVTQSKANIYEEAAPFAFLFEICLSSFEGNFPTENEIWIFFSIMHRRSLQSTILNFYR